MHALEIECVHHYYFVDILSTYQCVGIPEISIEQKAPAF
jgi:hypothetical protein